MIGIFFSLLYIFSTYLAPTTIFGDLAAFHVEQIIVAFAVIASLFNAENSGIGKMSQTYAILGMIVAIVFSLAFNGVWFTAPEAVMGFSSDIVVFFLILWSFRTRFHIQLLVGTLLVAALFTVYQGASAVARQDTLSPWVFMMGGGNGMFFRIRGMGFINDPNDLCQFLVGLIPCVFLLWRRGNLLVNLFVVLLPVSYLLYGMYLTHSRGGMVGLVVALIVLGRRKIGILPAVLSGAAVYTALSVIGWTGGRDINAESGSDRTEAWATGLKLIRSHPLFGVGYRRFEEYFYITAHNTIVVCAAEIGIVGFFFWTWMVFPTLYEAAIAARKPAAAPPDEVEAPRTAQSPARLRLRNFIRPTAFAARPALEMAFAAPVSRTVAQAVPPSKAGFVTHAPRFPQAVRSNDDPPVTEEEIRRMSGLVLVGLSGFLAAGWFLSRSYTMVLFVNMSLAAAVHRLAVERGVAPERLPLSKAAKQSAIVSGVLIALVYSILRVLNFLPK